MCASVPRSLAAARRTSLLSHLGIANVFDSDGPYPQVAVDDAAQRHPDLVVAPSEPCPFSARQLPELEAVAPTIFVDGKDMFWWGVRTPKAIDRLAERLAGAPGPLRSDPTLDIDSR